MATNLEKGRKKIVFKLSKDKIRTLDGKEVSSLVRGNNTDSTLTVVFCKEVQSSSLIKLIRTHKQFDSFPNKDIEGTIKIERGK